MAESPDAPVPRTQTTWLARAALAAGFCAWLGFAPMRDASDAVAVGSALVLLLGLNLQPVRR